VSTLAWIVVAGLAMSSVALVGSVTLVLPERTLKRLLMPLVAFAAGSPLGGALFHMLPESVDVIGNRLSLYVWLTAGFVTFFVLEQLLQWHHCHRAVSQHGPLGCLILLADGAHNLIGGLAVGGAFIVDVRLGVVTWLVAAAHEVPQELGDFGILVHSGWKPRSALLYNLASALTFLCGRSRGLRLVRHRRRGISGAVCCGNFIYIASAYLIPQITTTERYAIPSENRLLIRDKVEQSLALAAGLALLLVSTMIK
jgi:zinc and cadmium transporter